MEVSVVIPTACSGDQIEFVVARLFSVNRAFFERHSCEILLVDVDGHEEVRGACDRLSRRFGDTGTIFRRETTKHQGCHIQFREGLDRAQGAYCQFLIDEVISMYDFLEEQYEAAKLGFFAAMPYMVSSLPGTDTEAHFNMTSHILRFPVVIPVMAATFAMAKTSMFSALTEGTPDHTLGGHHWMLRAWEEGIAPVYASRHLKYTPVLQSTIEKPASYSTGTRLDPKMDRQRFINHWPTTKMEACWRLMTTKCESIVTDSGEPYVVKSPHGGIFLVRLTGGVPLPKEYAVMSTPQAVREEAVRALERWHACGMQTLERYEQESQEADKRWWRPHPDKSRRLKNALS